MGCEEVRTTDPNNIIAPNNTDNTNNTIEPNNRKKPKDDKIEESDLILDYDEEDNICYQESNLLWVDAKMNNIENKYYQNMINKIKAIKLFTFTNINDCINKLLEKDFKKFKKTFIMVSGSLSSEFFNAIENNLDKILVMPVIIIFTSESKKNIIKKNILSLTKFSLFDMNLVFDLITSIKEEFKVKILYQPKTKPIEDYKKGHDKFSFEYIENMTQLILPLFLKDFNVFPNKNEITNFNHFLLDKYSKNIDLKLLIEQLLLNIKIPTAILIKYWLRAYTSESDFYHEMNYVLGKKEQVGEEDEFVIYIRVLYHGLKEALITPFINAKLYRGARIKKDELEYINNSLKNKKDGLPACICYNKAFFSTSLDKSVAFKFIKHKKTTLKENEELVLFTIDKGIEIDSNNASNADMQDYSFHDDEKEILFFPFSSFEIINVEEKNHNNLKYYQINLNYLGKYVEKVEPLKNRKIPKNKFAKDFLISNFIKKTKLIKESKKFDFDTKEFIKQDDITNNIIAIYKITEADINKDIPIISHNDLNKKEISETCDIYLEGKKINFNFFYIFDKPGEYTFNFIFKDFLKNASKLFYKCKNIISLDLRNFKTDFITDMSKMFCDCSSIESLDLSSFNTQEVKTMELMFAGCTSLKSIDLSSFIDIEVINMNDMFSNCTSLTFLDLSNFKVKNVQYMMGMFFNCKSLYYLNLSNFETNSVTCMNQMFCNCNSLTSLTLSSKFDTYNVTDMNKMFYQCSSLNSIDLSNFSTSKVKDMRNMFSKCTSLTRLDLSYFITVRVEFMSEMFSECSSLTHLNIFNFSFDKIIEKEKMFFGCTSLDYLICPYILQKDPILKELPSKCEIKFTGNAT